jgi:drug/metabolite transporter (DMT)-like permease
MNVPRTTRWGLALALGAACISGLSVFLNGLMVKSFPDPTLLAGTRNGLVGLLFLGVLGAFALRARRSSGQASATGSPAPISDTVPLTRRQLTGLAFLGVVGGGLAFALFFGGLAQAVSPASAVLQKTLFLWVAIAAWPLLGERPGVASLAALAALLAGTLLLDPPAGLGFGLGELMILAATLLWTAETIVARRMLPSVGAGRGAAARMAIGSLVLLGIVAWTGDLAGLTTWTPEQWAFVGLTAVLLAGYVAAWYGALERAPAATVTSMLVVGALITATLRALTSGTPPTEPKLAGLALLLLGAAVAALATVRAQRRPASALATTG